MHPKDDLSKDTSIESVLENAQEDAARLLRLAQEDSARLLKNAREDIIRLLKRSEKTGQIDFVQQDVGKLWKNAQEDAARLWENAQEDAARLWKNAQEDAIEILRKTSDEPKTPSPDVPIETTAVKIDKMHTIGEMSSKLAHDLQNPLTIIKNTLEIMKLKNPNIDQKTKENYDRMERAATKMSQQIRDVLNYVRTSDIMLQKTSLQKMLKLVVDGLQVPPETKIMLPSEDVEVYCDTKQMETVFENLLTNAIQATGQKGRIMVQASQLDNATIIDVIDNGHGIESENLERVFEPLFTTKPGGTGLGLPSCKSIIENHGGTIECSSIVGKGTVFTIKIPRY